MKNCIECKRQFEPYKTTTTCEECNGDGYLESDFDDFMREDFIKCWRCKGIGEITFIESHFCDDDCRENHLNID